MKIVSPTLNQLTVNIKDASTDTVYYSGTVNDTNGLINAYGQWGLATYDAYTIYDSFALYSTDQELTLGSNKNENIPFGETITYTITDDEDKEVTLSDNGAGGTFSPSATIQLTTSNSYTETVTYTPRKAGNIKITASADTEEVEKNVFVSPYTLTIGFIGDSITDAGGWMNSAKATLGTGFSIVKQGVGASSSSDWGDDYFSYAYGTPAQ
jgi:hypothetical protein